MNTGFYIHLYTPTCARIVDIVCVYKILYYRMAIVTGLQIVVSVRVLIIFTPYISQQPVPFCGLPVLVLNIFYCLTKITNVSGHNTVNLDGEKDDR